MTALTFASPRNFFTKIADFFQPLKTMETASSNPDIIEEEIATQEHTKSKLNITLDDLKVISTALLHYRRNLSKQGDNQKAEGVERIDKQFYELIQVLETRVAS